MQDFVTAYAVKSIHMLLKDFQHIAVCMHSLFSCEIQIL